MNARNGEFPRENPCARSASERRVTRATEAAARPRRPDDGLPADAGRPEERRPRRGRSGDARPMTTMQFKPECREAP